MDGRRRRVWIAAIAVLGGIVSAGSALPARAGYSDSADEQKPEEITTAESALEAGNYARAIQVLQPFVQENPTNADGLTDLGLAYLKTGNAARAVELMEKSLAQEPTKLDTNEGLGEAYLATGNLTAAEARLKRLDGLCFFGCSEERELRTAISKYKTAH